ncbi:MAG: hypothetical protein ACR2H4_04780 [Pyrinomonadaceae bacterium]
MKKAKASEPKSEEYANFERLAKQLISVPKSEIDKRQAEYEREKKDAKKRKRLELNRAARSTQTLGG